MIRLAKRFDIIDYPNHRKIHTTPTPLLGGVAIFAAFTIVLFVHVSMVVFLKNFITGSASFSPELLFYANNTTHITNQIFAIVGGGLIIAIVGITDDIRGLSIWLRLLAEIAVAFLMVWMGFKPEIFLPEITTWIISIFWIVGITNAFNLLDGADGLAGGVGIISALILAGIMFFGNQPLIALCLLTIAAAIGGFIRYNLPPARIFMGSTGSMFIGYILSITTILATFTIDNACTNYVIVLPVVVMSMPLYDTLSVIFLRSIRKVSLTKGDLNHLVHRLMRAGFSQRKAVYTMYLISLTVGISGIFLIWTTTVQSIVVLSLVGVLLVGIFFFEYFLTKQNHRAVKLSTGKHGLSSAPP
ncbi:MAG: undecaprenyl/decaprenyl-phosphate alpha-N-acetylglucosaminyl 1-phosphate transferase [Candidatus Kuenenia sp.]|nr:undecaprenyl/decaprenyl-phosphate alpha-N-acetylglucosaminyl 1-phosphate transferase [Candidatus Kuenenia hertensis]